MFVILYLPPLPASTIDIKANIKIAIRIFIFPRLRHNLENSKLGVWKINNHYMYRLTKHDSAPRNYTSFSPNIFLI